MEVVIMNILKPHEVSKILRVTVKTLQNWDKTKKLVAFRNKETNRRYYTEQQINTFLGNETESRKIVIYQRVSNIGQKDDLKNQEEFLKQFTASSVEYLTTIGLFRTYISQITMTISNRLDSMDSKERQVYFNNILKAIKNV
jgi:predicted site-specific integrase-resolvase